MGISVNTHMQKKDYTGQKFKKLTAIRFVGNKLIYNKMRPVWLFRCECGKEVEISIHQVAYPKGLHSCGCLRRNGNSNYGWKGFGDISGKYWYRFLQNASRRGILCKISIQQAWELFLKQNKICALSGLPIKFSSNTRALDGNASLDRIDSSKGYVSGNIQWVHKDVNWMKQDFNEDYFIEMCQNITNFKYGNHRG